MTNPLVLQLEVTFADERPAGSVQAGGVVRPFSGWLGLMAVLEALAKDTSP